MPAIRSGAVNSKLKLVRRESLKELTEEEQADEQARIEELRVRKIEKAKNATIAKSKELAVWKGHDKTILAFMKLRDHRVFTTFIIFIIFVAAVMVGLQTSAQFAADNELALFIIDWVIMFIFVVEIVVKFVAEGKRPWVYFGDSWNVFDFFIVLVGFFPIGGGGAVQVLRLVRLLRVLKLVKALPKLQILVMGLINSMSSIAYIGILLGMLFYLFAVMAVSFFGENDPVYLGDLHNAFVTLFRCATLEDWTDVMYTAMYGCDKYGYDGMEHRCYQPQAAGPGAAIFFIVFIVISSMMILNLFIGVITSSMQDAKDDIEDDDEEDEETGESGDKIEEKLKELYKEMSEITTEIQRFAKAEHKRRISVLQQHSHLAKSSPAMFKPKGGSGLPFDEAAADESKGDGKGGGGGGGREGEGEENNRCVWRREEGGGRLAPEGGWRGSESVFASCSSSDSAWAACREGNEPVWPMIPVTRTRHFGFVLCRPLTNISPAGPLLLCFLLRALQLLPPPPPPPPSAA